MRSAGQTASPYGMRRSVRGVRPSVVPTGCGGRARNDSVTSRTRAKWTGVAESLRTATDTWWSASSARHWARLTDSPGGGDASAGSPAAEPEQAATAATTSVPASTVRSAALDAARSTDMSAVRSTDPGLVRAMAVAVPRKAAGRAPGGAVSGRARPLVHACTTECACVATDAATACQRGVRGACGAGFRTVCLTGCMPGASPGRRWWAPRPAGQRRHCWQARSSPGWREGARHDILAACLPERVILVVWTI